MKIWQRLIALTATVIVLQGCTCGFDCSSDDDEDVSSVIFTLGFTDAPAENVEEVWLKVDRITLTRAGGTDRVFDEFSIPGLGVSNGEFFNINLLQYQGSSELLVIEENEIPGGEYNSIVIDVLDGDVNDSYVKDINGQHELLVSGGQITLEGIFLSKEREVHTVEFYLARSLSYDLQDEVYRLDDEGIRLIQDSGDTGILSGALDQDLFDAGDCDMENDALQDIRVYLYQGGDVDANNLGDVYEPSDNDTVIAPYAVAAFEERSTAFGDYRYEFGFLPEGNYTVAFSCNAEGDDPEDLDTDDITIPNPSDQIYRVFVEEDEETFCDILEDSDSLCAGSIQETTGI